MKVAIANILEFNKIRQILESFTSTGEGARRAQELHPTTRREDVEVALRETTEARHLLQEGREIPLSDMPESRECLQALNIEGTPLTPAGLVTLGRLCETSRNVQSALQPRKSQLPLLSLIVDRLPDLETLGATIFSKLNPDTAEVRDEASPELRGLRARLFKMRQRLQNLLESYFHQRDTRKLLQDTVITIRNGRAVLPVKAECRGQLLGIVHGASASGATLFIEPMGTVEINNEIVSIEEEERREVERILLAVTDEARAARPLLELAVDLLGELDLIQSRAKLGQACDGCQPQILEGKGLVLVSARHPLLIGDLAARIGEPRPAREAVPVSFSVGGERTALIFTGPNTGGKTVALKTAGLLAMMAQAGLHLPANAGTATSVFKGIFADIGDEQSIGSSLSTFSYHLRNIVDMERGLEEPTLVLLDEVGTGTDPAEGGALGTAVVDHFRRRGALVLASTHHGMLRAYATTTPGVGVACFEFDPETYQPTYRLSEGSAGRSLAFEMAQRLGLPAAVVDRARELQDRGERQVHEMLDRLETEKNRLEAERERVSVERKELERLKERRTRLEEEEVRERRHRLSAFRHELEEDLASTRARLKDLMADVRSKTEQAASSTPSWSVASQAERAAEQELQRLAAEILTESQPTDGVSPSDLQPGTRVLIRNLGLAGVVGEMVGSHDAEVLVRDKKLRIHLSEIELAPEGRGGPKSHTGSPAHQGLERKRSPEELNVIGCSVEQALSQADKFLDDAFLSEHRTVRLIHGIGQGILKRAIGQWLAHHPHVASHQAEPSGAVTVVELKV